MTAVLLALAAAVGYGVSDFYGGVASRRVTALRVVIYSYPFSVLLVLAVLPFVSGSPAPRRWRGPPRRGNQRRRGVVVLRRAGRRADGAAVRLPPITAVAGERDRLVVSGRDRTAGDGAAR
ncbi:hypothetical protein [Nocardia asiatica]|uniref:hypothetical protein n=1 Tax=Nocardia asiatica TaxID=209252 RepID=UPI002458FBCB|nr:hypothetical protein [Nocardia asiatica]